MADKILVIGAGAAGSVVVRKCLQFPEVFSHIHIASRTVSKCNRLALIDPERITASQIDADDTQAVVALIQSVQPKLVINMALPYQDLSIMDACLKTGVHYIDTANYEPKDKAEFCYKWQWDYNDRFKERQILGLLGSGFDPGVTNVFCAYAQKHLFDQIHTIDIVDCNAGDHGKAFATNFNPEINIREITQKGKYYKDREWVQTEPMAISRMIDFPEVGPKKAYLMYHEELESLARHIPDVKELRFWMTFSEEYLNHLKVLQNVGMTSIEPIEHQGQDIIPLEFLKTLLPEPSSLGQGYTGQTCIGCVIEGVKDGQSKKIMIYNVCDHQTCYEEVRSQAVSYTTGVPAVISAKLLLEGVWQSTGVKNMEQFDPDPFMEALNQYGLPWQVKEYVYSELST